MHSRTAVTIGNFDGCHLGHQALIRAAVEHGLRLQATPAAMTFSPRPEAYFQGRTDERLLFTDAQKSRALAELGIARHVVRAFDATLARTSHAAFYDHELKAGLHAAALVVGDDFRFGEGRKGDTAYLAERSAHDGIAFTIGAAAMWNGERISSTRIRTILSRDGDAAAAAAMLGRPYLLEGEIKRGDQLGRQLGVPTANLEEVRQLLPRFGIYAGWVALDTVPVTSRPKDAWPAVFSLGVRPTLGQTSPPVRVEAHLLAGEWGKDALYGRHAGYYLAHWLRGEERFPDLETLKAQMARDIAAARHLVAK